MQTYDGGSAIRITANVTDYAGTAQTADTCTVTIVSPANETKANTNMVAETTAGAYYYVFQSGEADTRGVYAVKVRAVKGGYTGLVKSYLFKLE